MVVLIAIVFFTEIKRIGLNLAAAKSLPWQVFGDH
jgi:hypothetical protein